MDCVSASTKFDCQAPVIIIGAGRSGSTLLSAIFNFHPKISFFGESYFLAPFVWEKVFEKHGLIMSYLVSWRKPEGVLDGDFRVEERKRISRLIAQFVADVMRIDPKLQHWGYKEIWNGSPHFETFGWLTYDAIFPKAKWVHLVRNPIRFAISTGGRDNNKFTRKIFEGQLSNWVKIHEYNCKRAEKKNYYLLKYEDIISKPEKTIKGLLDFAEIKWDKRCLNAMEQRYVPSHRNPIEGVDMFLDPLTIPGLYNYALELGYIEDIKAMGIDIRP